MNTLLLAAHELEYGVTIASFVVAGIVGAISLATFIWAIVRVIQMREVDVAGLPWVAWLLIVLLTGNIGQIVYLVLSYIHEKKQKEAAANGLYYDGRNYYAPINPTGDHPANAPYGAPHSNPVYPSNPGPSFNQTFPYSGPHFATPADGPADGPAGKPGTPEPKDNPADAAHPEPEDPTKHDGPIEPPAAADR